MRSLWRPTWPHVVFIIGLVIAGLIVLTVIFQKNIDEVKREVLDYVQRELRVPLADSVVYMPFYTEYLRKHSTDKPRIGLFGPSTVYGTTVMKSGNTTAGIIQKDYPEFEVANLGLTGARFTETYAILADVIDAIDYVVFEINYGIVVISDNEQDSVVYPQLVEKLGQFDFGEWSQNFPGKESSGFSTGLHKWVKQQILNEWALYRNRDVFTYKNLKTRTSKEGARRLYQQWMGEGSAFDKGKVSPPSLTTAYERMSKEQQHAIHNHFRQLYKWGQPFDPANSFGLFMMEQTLKLLKADGKQVLFYTAPLDKQLIDQEKLIDWQQYNEVMRAYQSLIESYQYPFVDFNQDDSRVQLDHSYYHDPSHLLDPGSKQFGELLSPLIADRLLPKKGETNG